MRAHPVHSDFRLSWPVDCYVNNLENGVIPSYINDEFKFVSILKSTLYNGGNLVVIISAFFSQKMNGEKRHREITPTAISGPRFHAPLHISPHFLAQQGVRRAPEGEGALAGGI